MIYTEFMDRSCPRKNLIIPEAPLTPVYLKY
jgi:hypothetical protein